MNGQLSSAQNVQQGPAENLEYPTSEVSQQGILPSAGQQPSVELTATSRMVQVPNSKVFFLKYTITFLIHCIISGVPSVAHQIVLINL